ncbi:MAG: hypothetical protein AAF667_07525 [Pseudomonadota bacterium]
MSVGHHAGRTEWALFQLEAPRKALHATGNAHATKSAAQHGGRPRFGKLFTRAATRFVHEKPRLDTLLLRTIKNPMRRSFFTKAFGKKSDVIAIRWPKVILQLL